MHKEIYENWVRGGGVGLSPWAPGTLASVVAACIWPLWILLPSPMLLPVWIVVALFSLWACYWVMREETCEDPSWIVIDEMLAVWLIPVVYNGSWNTSWLAVWVLFRVLDITKAWPVSWAEKVRPVAVAIMLDDLVAVLLAIALVTFWWS